MKHDIILPLVGYIELTRGQKAIVDWADLEWLSQWLWGYASGYAVRTSKTTEETGNWKSRRIMMHRAILEYHGHCLEGLEVDHIDGNRLNNVKSNLRPATRQQNAANRSRHNNNTSGTAGVHYHKLSGKWRATITYKGRCIELGLFAEKSDAIAARKKAIIEYFGEFANCNDDVRQPLATSLTTTEKPVKRGSASGHPGIWWDAKKQKWIAAVKVGHKAKKLGFYDRIEDAIASREKVLASQEELEKLKTNRRTGNKSSTGHLGVYWNKNSSKWTVQLHLNSKKRYLGMFDQIEDAIAARDEAIKSPPPPAVGKKRPVRKNASGHFGVIWHKASSKWSVQLSLNGQKKHLGLFETIEEAIFVRNKALLENQQDFIYENDTNNGSE